MPAGALFQQLLRRIQMVVSVGRVTAISDSGPVQKLQVQTPVEVRSDTPRMSEFGFSSSLPVGSDVLVAFLGGDRSSGVIIASNHQSFRQSGLKPGETIIYNQWGQYVKLTEKGIEIQANGQDVSIHQARKVRIEASEEIFADTPVLRVSGDVIDNADGNRVSLKQLRDAFNLHVHPVAGVETGSSTVNSKPPLSPVGGGEDTGGEP